MKNVSFGLDTFGDNAIDLQGNPALPVLECIDLMDQLP